MGNGQYQTLYRQKGQSVRLLRKQEGERVAMRLFCFAYAGGSASVFASWSACLPGFVEVCAVELPGRDSLFKEPPFERLPPLIQEIADSMEQSLDLPYVLFGHSMGGLLAFELARELRHRGALEPATLFISAHRAPHLPDPGPMVAELPDDEFIDELKRLQGTPPEVFEDIELMVLLLPLLRADFALCENYEYKQEIPLDCPIFAFGGLDDTELEYEEVLAWREHTRGEFRVCMMPGNHFFIHTAKESILRVLTEVLSYS